MVTIHDLEYAFSPTPLIYIFSMHLMYKPSHCCTLNLLLAAPREQYFLLLSSSEQILGL